MDKDGHIGMEYRRKESIESGTIYSVVLCFDNILNKRKEREKLQKTICIYNRFKIVQRLRTVSIDSIIQQFKYQIL